MTDVALPSLRAALADVIGTFAGAHLVVLFGSRARGSAASGSDVDLAIDATNVDPGELAARVSERLGIEADVTRLQDASIPLLKALINDGIVVYESSPGRGALWRSRVLAQLETDGPWFDRMRDAWIKRVAKEGFGHGQ
jgi:predicted nucleotidyltransferase